MAIRRTKHYVEYVPDNEHEVMFRIVTSEGLQIQLMGEDDMNSFANISLNDLKQIKAVIDEVITIKM